MKVSIEEVIGLLFTGFIFVSVIGFSYSKKDIFTASEKDFIDESLKNFKKFNIDVIFDKIDRLYVPNIMSERECIRYVELVSSMQTIDYSSIKYKRKISKPMWNIFSNVINFRCITDPVTNSTYLVISSNR